MDDQLKAVLFDYLKNNLEVHVDTSVWNPNIVQVKLILENKVISVDSTPLGDIKRR